MTSLCDSHEECAALAVQGLQLNRIRCSSGRAGRLCHRYKRVPWSVARVADSLRPVELTLVELLRFLPGEMDVRGAVARLTCAIAMDALTRSITAYHAWAVQVSMCDGAVGIKVDAVLSRTEVQGTVVADCTLPEQSRVSIRSQKIRMPFLTARDCQDLKWVASQGINFVAVPFTRYEEDVTELRDQLNNYGGDQVRCEGCPPLPLES